MNQVIYTSESGPTDPSINILSNSYYQILV